MNEIRGDLRVRSGGRRVGDVWVKVTQGKKGGRTEDDKPQTQYCRTQGNETPSTTEAFTLLD